MAFVKLDTGILDSTLWIEREQREVFITALLMAEPREFNHPLQQIAISSLDHTGFEAPPGWYGFVPAASFGIINRAGVDREAGLEALKRLGEPEFESRSKDFDGRRMIRIDGGFLILNYMKYRDKDHTSAERQQRLRDRRIAREQSEEFKEAWDAIVAFYGNKCAYCEKEPWVDIADVVPIRKGEKHQPSNVVPACHRCISEKKRDTWKPRRFHPYLSNA